MDRDVEWRPALDGLRGMAVTLVVLTHVAFWTGHYTDDPLGRLLARGDVAVALFFVLSGFLLSTPFLHAAAAGHRQPAAAPYLWRRALRILPAYWLTVIVVLLVLPGNRDAGPGTWLAHVAIVQFYGSGGGRDGLVQLWSLTPEVAFYLVLPWLVRWIVGGVGGLARPGRVLGRLAAVAAIGPLWLGVVTALGPDVGPLNLWLPAFTSWFAAGMGLGVLAVSDRAWWPARMARMLGSGPGTCWAGAAVLLWLAATPLAGPLGLDRPTVAEAVTKHVLYVAVGVMVILPLVFGEPGRLGVTAVLTTRPAVWVGKISYGLFLFHLAVLTGGYALVGRPPFTGSLVLVFVVVWSVSVVLATLSYRYLELPVMRWGRSLATAPRPRSDSVPEPLDERSTEVLARATSAVVVCTTSRGARDVTYRTGPPGFVRPVRDGRALVLPAPDDGEPPSPGTSVVVVASTGSVGADQHVQVEGTVGDGTSVSDEHGSALVIDVRAVAGRSTGSHG